MTNDNIVQKIARAICREQCAFFGDPPCYETGDWPNPNCDEPGCIALAESVKAEIEETLPTNAPMVTS